MIDPQQRAVLTLCLMAAFADGGNSERERAEIKRIADTLGADGALDVAAIYQDVLLAQAGPRATVAAAIARAGAPAVRLRNGGLRLRRRRRALAGRTRVPGRLAQALGLDAGRRERVTRQADAVAAAPLAGHCARRRVVAAVPASAAELDPMILNYAILNGALELLPQSLASMAIIPLQMKMVYRIGKAHGFELDRGHINDLLATVGVGLTSQYVEQIGRKLVGGLLGKIGGGLLGGLGSATTGAAFSFATTYALGQVAKRYYAGGRRSTPTRCANLHVDAGRGEAAAGQVHRRHRAAGEEHRRRQARRAGQGRPVAARSARRRPAGSVPAVLLVDVVGELDRLHRQAPLDLCAVRTIARITR